MTSFKQSALWCSCFNSPSVSGSMILLCTPFCPTKVNRLMHTSRIPYSPFNMVETVRGAFVRPTRHLQR